jgi:Rhodopirellula transposase DDE domain
MGVVASELRDHVVESFFQLMGPYLDEKLMRLSAGALALAFGEGATGPVAAAAGLAVSTVGAGARDLRAEDAPTDRIRRPGAGRHCIEQVQPGLWTALDALIEPEERGDPANPLRWTVKSTRTLADELARQRHPVSHTVVGRLLREHGYSLRGTAKVLEGKAAHGEDRDRQFRHINDTVCQFVAAGDPVISVDTKKKEPVGNFERPGRTWRPYRDPVKVEDHTFAKDIDAVAVPYGVYDVGAGTGFVNVGISHDTPAFAVASVRRWWQRVGRGRYLRAGRLLIVADSGGSNAARSLVFKILLHQLALEIGLRITVAHMPPGTSKWNKVEHRLFAQISSNWRGRPLTSLDVVVSSISATTTRSGMSITCVLDENEYPTGNSGSWDELERLPITFADFRGAWNYTIAPRPALPPDALPPGGARPGAPRRPRRTPIEPIGDADKRAAWTRRLSTPEITGIPADTWTALAPVLHTAYQDVRDRQAQQARGGRPSAYPTRRKPELKLDTPQLMLAVALHVRHRLPTAQISRLLDIHPVALKQHIDRLMPLFAEHGHPLTPTGQKIKKLEELTTRQQPVPQTQEPTRDVTS